MAEVTELGLVRFLKRLASIKSEIKVAQVRVDDINKALQDNVDKQKILNQHLAKQNEAWRNLASTKTPAPLLTLVKSSQPIS